MIGARGSGEAPQAPDSVLDPDPANLGIGENLAPTYTDFKSQNDKKGIITEVIPVNYPAYKVDFLDPVINQDGAAGYAESVKIGIGDATTQVRNVLGRGCTIAPQIIMMGYSQGALVVEGALNALKSSERKLITGVLLFGDPMYDPTKSYAEGGVGVLGAGGILLTLKSLSKLNRWTNLASFLPLMKVTKKLPSDMANRTYDYCYPEDPVCQPLASGSENISACQQFLSTCPHFSYATNPFGATEWLVSIVRKMQPSRPIIVTTQLPDGRVGVPYSATLTGTGFAPLTWSTDAPADGLSVSSDGRISGTPTTAGSGSIAVTLTDGLGRTSSARLRFTIGIALTFAIVPSGGAPAGTTLRLHSVAPCLPGSHVDVRWTAADGKFVQTAPYTTTDVNGAWDTSLLTGDYTRSTSGPISSPFAAQSVPVQATCYSNTGGATAPYATQLYPLTQGASFRWTTASDGVGFTASVSSVGSCPAGSTGARVSVSSAAEPDWPAFNYVWANYPGDGSWSVPFSAVPRYGTDTAFQILASCRDSSGADTLRYEPVRTTLH